MRQEPRTGPKLTKRLSVRVPPEFHARVAQTAKTVGATPSELVDLMLRTPTNLTDDNDAIAQALVEYRQKEATR